MKADAQLNDCATDHCFTLRDTRIEEPSILGRNADNYCALPEGRLGPTDHLVDELVLADRVGKARR